jgi:enterochelin esterase family protein
MLRSSSFLTSLLVSVPLCAALVLGCSSSSDGGSSDDGGDSGGSGGSDSGGSGGVVNGGGDAGSSPSGGTSAGGSGGDTGGESGSGGSGGDTGGGGFGGGSGGAAGDTSNQGVQGDPGTTGDGPATQPEPYNQPAEVTGHVNGAPTGTVSDRQLYASKGLYPGYMFEYYIYVPAQYQPGKPAALMVFQDGLHYLGRTEAHFNTPTVFDNLIHSGDMPVTIGLFLTTGTPDGNFVFDTQREIREMEYSLYSETYAKFLLEEIIPDVITSQYDIVSDPDGWAIGGQSSGGTCSLNVGMHRPDNFHKILTQNGAFDNAGQAYPGAIDNSPLLPLRVYLLSGPNDIAITYQFNQSVVASLQAKGYHYRYLEGTGGHFPPDQAVADYPEALRWLWKEYTLPWYP